MDVGIDVGGTFTDLVALDAQHGRLIVLKVPSTPQDQSLGMLAALEAAGVGADSAIVHGTTVATNTILERKGASCGLITTRGFRDVLELRRRDRPRTYGLSGWFEPLVPRDLRLEVAERIDHDGAVIIPLAEDEVAQAARQLRGLDVIVIAFLHAYANPAHERRAREIIQAECPDASVVIASDVLAEYREFERTSTAVVNGYVQPVMARYLGRLSSRLEESGYQRELLLVQSNGGVMSSTLAQELPVNTVLSGPAAGVVAGAAIAAAAGFPNALTADVGGTSFDVALVADGAPRFAEEKLVEYGVPIRIPHVDIVTIGAGGGSIAWIDRGGVLRVGPQSAGAEPGPAAYARGGAEPTVTDAQLALGRINPRRPIGGASARDLDVQLARQALQASVAEPLGLSIERAALAVIRVANSAMAASIRAVSVERGYDPRDFALVGFGGAGPLHACALMKEVDIGAALIPPYPGVTSALGCIMADFRHDFVQTVNQPLPELDIVHAYQILDQQAAQGLELLRSEGLDRAACLRQHQADMAYEGQIYTLRVDLPQEPPSSLDHLRTVFEDTYRREYGHVLGQAPIVVTNLRTTVVGRRRRLGEAGLSWSPSADGDPLLGQREVFFEDAFVPTPVFQRDRLASGARLEGPCIVEQADTTLVIEPDTHGQVDALGNIIIRRAAR